MRILNLIFYLLIFYFLSSCVYDKVIDELKPIKSIKPIDLAYKGDATCKACHASIYEEYFESGHKHAFTKTDSVQPSIPFTTMAGETIILPSGYNWISIPWLIGGFAWKANFVDINGYVISGKNDAQYNLYSHSQSAYHLSDVNGSLKFSCGKCHTTGWKSISEGATAHNNLAGMDGDYAKEGVQCEACHGMGSIHASTKLKSDISIDRSAATCGKCHALNTDGKIEAESGFIKGTQQYEEFMQSKHASLTDGCLTCHDAHASSTHDKDAKGTGITKKCIDCHSQSKYTDYKMSAHHANECTDCHMPEIVKVASKKASYRADAYSHIFKINKSDTLSFFNTDSSYVNLNGKGLPINMVCYRCHKNDNGTGGSASKKSLHQLYVKAIRFHESK